MAFEKGHKHGAKSRAFDGALRRAIAQDDGERLRKSAEQLLDHAAAGTQWAIALLADRLDGKADQHVSVETRRVEDLSLAELAAEVAAARGGDTSPAAGADQPSGLH